jgi:hypothetical protein
MFSRKARLSSFVSNANGKLAEFVPLANRTLSATFASAAKP